MSTPTPRPALRKAADAHIHPAAPGHSPRGLRHAEEEAPDASDQASGPPQDQPAPPEAAGPGGHRLSGPPTGTTSDSLRTGKGGRRRGQPDKAPQEKLVTLDVQVPKSLRKELRAAAKASRHTPDEIVTALLRGWLQG